MMKDQLLKALNMKYMGEIEAAKANIEIYLTNSVGIGEHPDIIGAIDSQMHQIAEAEDKIVVLRTHFIPPKI